MHYIIRKAVSTDYEKVNQIFTDVQNLHVEMRPDIFKTGGDILPKEVFEKELENDSFYVADVSGNVVGVLQVSIRHIESPFHVTRNILFIDSIAVAEKYRKNGIAHSLLELAKKIKQQKKFDAIELQVNSKNKSAYEIYRHYGFSEKSINLELL